MSNGESKVLSAGRVVAINLSKRLRAGQVIQREGQSFVVSGDGTTAVLQSIARNPSQTSRVVGINPAAVSPWVTLAILAGLGLMFWSANRAD